MEHENFEVQENGEAPLLAYSIREFCAAVKISSQMFFKLGPASRPQSFLVGRRRLISADAARNGIKKREAECNSATA